MVANVNYSCVGVSDGREHCPLRSHIHGEDNSHLSQYAAGNPQLQFCLLHTVVELDSTNLLKEADNADEGN